jgi:DNA-binding PadR family transcriptional regulator
MNPVRPLLELQALIALASLGEGAYGVTVQDEIRSRTGRVASVAACYAALERLARDGLAEAWFSPPRAERGGRSRRHYRLTAAGREALRQEREATQRLWRGIALRAPGRSR